jgi:hypothetical protein
MRVLVDLRSHLTNLPLITQVEPDTPEGTAGVTQINGKFLLPIIKGAEFPITEDSYVLDGAGECDGGDVSSISFAHLLAQYPMYGHVYFNPLLTTNHVGDLDLTGTMTVEVGDPPVSVEYPARFQTGMPPGHLPGFPLGQMPTHTALLPINDGVDPAYPGLLLTEEIDIGPYTVDPDTGLEVGADEFMVYWKLYGFVTTDDVANAAEGPGAGQNQPSMRLVTETEQEPDGFSAYISPDDGAHWCRADLLEPVAFFAKTTKIRLAFRNDGTEKVYIACFAVLF